MVSSGQPPAIVGTNLNAMNPNGGVAEMPFLNILKEATPWHTTTAISVGSGTGEEKLLYTSFLDANGYPTTLTGGPAHTFNYVYQWIFLSVGSSFAPATYYPAGDYLLQWDGQAQFQTIDDSVLTCASTTSPCVITVGSPTATGFPLFLTATGAGANYGRNFSLIYCGTWNGSSCSNGADTQLVLCKAGDYTKCFFGEFTDRLAGVKALRFMDWTSILSNSQANWANRRSVNWYTFTDSPSNLTENGGNPQTFIDGVPYEYMFGLCNKLNADCWMNVLPLADDTYVTNLGTLAHSSLNSNLKAYVEYGNEWWNGPHTSGTIGQITGFIDNGAGGGAPSGVAGKVLTVTAIGPDGSTPILNTHSIVDLAHTTGILSQTSGTSGGVGVYLTNGDQDFNNVLVTPAQTLTVSIDTYASAAISGRTNYALAGFGARVAWGDYLRAVQVGHLFKAAWGADGNRVMRVAAGQYDNIGAISGADCILSALPSQASCVGVSGPSFWYGTTAGTLASNMDAFAIAPYFWWAGNYGIPDAWGVDADGGVAKFTTEIITGGVEPTANVPGNCGNGAGLTCDPVDNAHYTLTSGSGLSSDPANGFAIMAKMNTTNGVDGSGKTFLKVDSMTSYPILLNDQGCPGNNVGAGILPTNQEVAFYFTTSIIGCAPGAITKGWRGQYQQWATVPGAIPDTFASGAQQSCNAVAANGGGIPMIAYESGQNFNSSSVSYYSTLVTAVMRNTVGTTMGNAYDVYYRTWAAMTPCHTALIMNFNDIGQISGGGFIFWWNLLENVQNTTSPRYDVVRHTYWGQP